MAKYTIELRYLEEILFDFEYKFYSEDSKKEFQQKFLDHYYFNEIGFETVQRFKQQLKAYLNRIYPYYKELYEIELRCKDIDFMLNKDLKETFIRELEENERNNLSTNQIETNSSNTNVNTIENSSALSKNKESNIADGVANSMLDNGFLTNVSENSDNSNNESNSASNINTNSNINSKNDATKNNKQFEKTELISQGNIGVTSSAELKQKWIDVTMNLDEKIILGARYLFMYIY